MRAEATRIIYETALKNKDIIFIAGDLGHSFAEKYRENIPGQYINTGLAEQNMIGVAAGLALSGKKVFTFSITTFALMRCFEQIRVDVCYQNLDVTIIGVGAGFAYNTSGCTHFGTEDITIMRALPNMKIYCPCHPLEARFMAEKVLRVGGPAYLRLGKGKETPISELAGETLEDVESGKGVVVLPGTDMTIFATGHIVTEAISAANKLKKHGWSMEVINIHTIKPLDKEIVLDRAKSRKAVFSLEEHVIYGGLGSAISEVISEASFKARPLVFKRFGIRDRFTSMVGQIETLRKDNAIDNENIVREILDSIA